MAGTFISFEGVDGSGKSTQVARLASWLETRPGAGPPLVVREPGGTRVGEQLRAILLDPETGAIADTTEALLYAASRAELVSSVIRPARARGQVVIADRFVDSSLAYQGAGRNLGIDDVWRINEFAMGTTLPDRTLIFDVPPDVTRARLAAGGATPDRLEAAGDAFYARVRDGWQRIAERFAERVTVIDASGDVDATWRQVRTALEPLLSRELHTDGHATVATSGAGGT